MIYILIAIVWIGAIYFIHRHFEQKKSVPTLKAQEHTGEARQTVKISLAELSTLWEKKKTPVATKYKVELGELVPLYKSAQATPPIIELSLAHQRLEDFYDNHVKSNTSYTETLMRFTVDLMKFLDKNGDCPSVVQVSKLDSLKREYDLLATVTLLDHSIDTAEEMLKLYASPLAIPDAIAVALSHDLGKIPAFHNFKYSTGDHPDLSVQIIRNEIPSFKKLDEKLQEEIINAVVSHHKSPTGELGKSLITADQTARRKEVQAIEDRQYAERKNNLIRPTEVVNSAEPAKITPVNSATKQETTVYDMPAEKSKYVKPEEVDMVWLSVEEFIGNIKSAINLVDANNKFNAFSTSNGYVYFMTGFLTDTLVAMGVSAGNTHCQAINAEENKQEKRKLGSALLNSAVNILKDRGMIPDNLCGKGFFGNKFIVKYKKPVDGKSEMKAFYTPFLASAFSEQVSDLEKNKPQLLKNIMSVEIAAVVKEA